MDEEDAMCNRVRRGATGCTGGAMEVCCHSIEEENLISLSGALGVDQL